MLTVTLFLCAVLFNRTSHIIIQRNRFVKHYFSQFENFFELRLRAVFNHNRAVLADAAAHSAAEAFLLNDQMRLILFSDRGIGMAHNRAFPAAGAKRTVDREPEPRFMIR